MKPKLMLTDLDGTLLRDDKSLSPANRSALERAAAGGCQIVVATGRLWRVIPQFLLDLPFLRYFILMNGAKILDRQTGEVLYRCEIPLKTAKKVFDLMEPLDCTVDCFQNDRGIMARSYYDRLDYYIPDPISRIMAQGNREPVDDFWGAVQAGGPTVQKVQMYFPHLELRPQAAALLQREVPELVQGISMPGNLELNAAGATKGIALEKLCAALRIDPLDAIAFGDGTNDISMLRSAGIGVAMANAAPETLAAADLIAPSNQEDGVAQILNRFF